MGEFIMSLLRFIFVLLVCLGIALIFLRFFFELCKINKSEKKKRNPPIASNSKRKRKPYY